MIFNNFNELKYLLNISLLENIEIDRDNAVKTNYTDSNDVTIVIGDTIGLGDNIYTVKEEGGDIILDNTEETIILTDDIADEVRVIFDLVEEISTADAIGLSLENPSHPDAIFPLMSSELGMTNFMRRIPKPSKKKKKRKKK